MEADSTQHLSFRVWLSPLSRMSSRFVYVTAECQTKCGTLLRTRTRGAAQVTQPVTPLEEWKKLFFRVTKEELLPVSLNQRLILFSFFFLAFFKAKHEKLEYMSLIRTILPCERHFQGVKMSAQPGGFQ